jgi:hypothetical protein
LCSLQNISRTTPGNLNQRIACSGQFKTQDPRPLFNGGR